MVSSGVDLQRSGFGKVKPEKNQEPIANLDVFRGFPPDFVNFYLARRLQKKLWRYRLLEL